MEKEQTHQLALKHEIKKQKTIGYPFYVVMATHSQQDHHFIFTVDYYSDTAAISVNTYRQDMTKLITANISLTDLLPRKIISFLRVVNFNFKPNSSTISILSAEFIVGYRSGQLVIIEYKNKSCKIKQKLNKSIKSEGFFSKTTSAFFGSQDTYSSYIKGSLRNFYIHSSQPIYATSYWAGNSIIISKQLSQSNEYKFFTAFEQITPLSPKQSNKAIKNGDYFMFNCQYYYMLQDQQNKICKIDFKQEIGWYIVIEERNQLAVCCKQNIIFIDMINHFTIKFIISCQIPIRKITSFTYQKQLFLAILPEENHFLLYSFKKQAYCKMIGHRSFISTLSSSQKQGIFLTSGMDHRIGIQKMSKIKQQIWLPQTVCAENTFALKQYNILQQRLDDIFVLTIKKQGQISRNNTHSYGFGDCQILGNCFCCPTYDYRIMIYSLE